jgi:hypothetical protein
MLEDPKEPVGCGHLGEEPDTSMAMAEEKRKNCHTS